MHPGRQVLCLLAGCIPLVTGRPARAQACPMTFGPVGPDFRTSQTVAYDQVWSMVSRGPSRWTFAWSEGQDVWARYFNLSLAPLGSQFHVNTQFQVGIQDEPAISHGTTGNCLIAWSERNGYDGSGM